MNGVAAEALSPAAVRSKLEALLQDKMEFLCSAKKSFKQFDDGKTGVLEYSQVVHLVAKLVKNLSLPPVEDTTLLHIFKKYDTEQNGHLSLEEFAQFYWRLLWRIKDKYYPPRSLGVRREQFVGRHALQTDIKEIFDFEERIGGGSFGEVYLVRERFGARDSHRVCKLIDKSQAAVPMEQIEAEIIVLKRLDHPNIIKIYEVYEDQVYVYIIMEYCQGGELLQKILELSAKGEVMSEYYTACIMYQIFKALSYFHFQNIVHKDLKPENIMFHDQAQPLSTVKVIDFGLAEIFHTAAKKALDGEGNDGGGAGGVADHDTNKTVYSHNAAGTVLYMAPEVFQRRLSLKCDIWSAGCLMYLMLTGHLPYSGDTVGEIRQKVMDQLKPKYLQHGYLSPLATDLLSQCLTKNVKKRPTAAQVLEHDWFKAILNPTQSPLPGKYMENFRKISRISELKLCMLNVVAHQLDLTNPQVQEIGRLFISLDTDHNGTLSVSELRHALVCEEEKHCLNPWEFNKVFQLLDLDNDSEISYTEFLTAAYTWRQSEITLVWTAFNKLHDGEEGSIAVDHLIKLLSATTASNSAPRSMGPTATKRLHRLEAAVRKLDRNGDGHVDWQEFISYIRGK